ncbi:MAG: hypothetical protein RLZZ09_622 [Pseudomonadota bacterium]|jgi:hypothetical protein
MNTDRQRLECVRDQIIAARIVLSGDGESAEPEGLDPMGYYRLPALLLETEQELGFENLPVEEETLKAA